MSTTAENFPGSQDFMLAAQGFETSESDIGIASMATKSFLASTQEYASLYGQLLRSETGVALCRIPSLASAANNVLSDGQTLGGIVFQRFSPDKKATSAVAANLLFMHEVILTSELYKDLKARTKQQIVAPTETETLQQYLDSGLEEASKSQKAYNQLSDATVFAYTFRYIVYRNMSDWTKLFEFERQQNPKTNS